MIGIGYVIILSQKHLRQHKVLCDMVMGGMFSFHIILQTDKSSALFRRYSEQASSKLPSKGIVQQHKGHEQFDEVLLGLHHRILDSNKRVQEAACSAFVTPEEATLFCF